MGKKSVPPMVKKEPSLRDHVTNKQTQKDSRMTQKTLLECFRSNVVPKTEDPFVPEIVFEKIRKRYKKTPFTITRRHNSYSAPKRWKKAIKEPLDEEENAKATLTPVKDVEHNQPGCSSLLQNVTPESKQWEGTPVLDIVGGSNGAKKKLKLAKYSAVPYSELTNDNSNSGLQDRDRCCESAKENLSSRLSSHDENPFVSPTNQNSAEEQTTEPTIKFEIEDETLALLTQQIAISPQNPNLRIKRELSPPTPLGANRENPLLDFERSVTPTNREEPPLDSSDGVNPTSREDFPLNFEKIVTPVSHGDPGLNFEGDMAPTTSDACGLPEYCWIQEVGAAVNHFPEENLDGIKFFVLTSYRHPYYKRLNADLKKSVYCTEVTAQLYSLLCKEMKATLTVLPLDLPYDVPECPGLQMTFLDANHCPGSAMAVFRTSTGLCILHTGDMRAGHEITKNPLLQSTSIDKLYVDNLYMDQRYDFPSQEAVLSMVTEEVKKWPPTTLICIGTYRVGKEKLCKAVSEALDSNISVMLGRLVIWKCLGDPDLTGRCELYGDSTSKSRIYVEDMRDVTRMAKKLLKHSQGAFDACLIIKPTACDFNNLKDKLHGDFVRKKAITIWKIPYSEHSSHSELKKFVQDLKPKEIVPTVVPSETREEATQLKQILRSWIQAAN